MQKERNVHAEHCKNIELECSLNNRMEQEKADVERLTNNIRPLPRKKRKLPRRNAVRRLMWRTSKRYGIQLQSLSELQEKRLRLESVRDKVREEYAGCN